MEILTQTNLISWEEVVEMYNKGDICDETFNELRTKFDKSGTKKQDS